MCRSGACAQERGLVLEFGEMCTWGRGLWARWWRGTAGGVDAGVLAQIGRCA